MMKFWPRFVSACHRRYGDVFTLRVASMGTLVYLARPEDIKTVFGGDPAVYHAGEANSMLAGLLGSSSVLVVDDAEHRDRRRLMLAPFRREAVARQTGLIARIAADNIAGWPIGRTFAVAPKMSEITLEVILRTVIGATDEQRLAQLRAVMPKLLSVGVWESLAINTPVFSAWRRGARSGTACGRPTACSTPRSPNAGPIPISLPGPTRWR